MVAETTNSPVLPGHDDDEYEIKVLQLRPDQTEDDLDYELSIRVAELGIDLATTSDAAPPTAPIPSSPTTPINHNRTSSAETQETTSTVPTSPASVHSQTRPITARTNSASTANVLQRKRAKTLSFSYYDKYISEVDPHLTQPKFVPPSPGPADAVGHGHGHGHRGHERTFSAGSKASYTTLKRGLTNKLRWRRRPERSSEVTISCICCREDFNISHNDLQTLPCGHTYCQACLAVMINQSTTDESKMPPRCCTQPIPGKIVKEVLARDEQLVFLNAVLQYSTPWEARIFCPSSSCGEFIPPRTKIDPKHPFETVCRHCRTRVCVMCKRNAHRLGADCPDDWELDAVLRMGEKSGWRRCYKCRTLVELDQGCTHMTCRCKAQFCYICGAVWDPAVGCPNFCNGEEELERRRMEEIALEQKAREEQEKREAAAALEEEAQKAADARTAADPEFVAMRACQTDEMRRFKDFERAATDSMRARHARQKRTLADRYKDLADKMRERHAKTEQHLEDRQLEAEMELRTNLDQSEKKIRIRLKHMEAYCSGANTPGRSSSSSSTASERPDSEDQPASPRLPRREVTQKDLDELGQQYHVRDGMERRHQSQINVMREKQAKRMEELLERQTAEADALEAKREEDLEGLMVVLTNEEDALGALFEERKERMMKRWEVAAEVLRVELEERVGERFGRLRSVEWLDDEQDAGGGDAEGGPATVQEATSASA